VGFFMVNAEGGYNEQAMTITIAAWSLLLYLAIALTWGEFGVPDVVLGETIKAAGMLLLVVLAALYHGGADGRQTMTPQWWGILGLIGWAYLAACVLYRLSKGRLTWLLVMIAGCIAYYAVSHLNSGADNPVQRWLLSHDGHAAHTSIVLCGIVCTLVFLDSERRLRFAAAALFVLLLVAAGWWLRPYFKISKIYATPTWCLYSAAICTTIFALLYALVELKQNVRWIRLVQPAAENPLVTYLLPFIISAALSFLGWQLPASLSTGAIGVLWAAFYAVAVLWLVSRISRLPFRLRL
jgi:predicted acyltransferase